MYVNSSESITILPLELKPVVFLTVIVPEPDIVALEVIASIEFLPKSVEAELKIFSPLAAITLLLKNVINNTASSEVAVTGTTERTCLLNPLILLYPPSTSGSKFSS